MDAKEKKTGSGKTLLRSESKAKYKSTHRLIETLFATEQKLSREKKKELLPWYRCTKLPSKKNDQINAGFGKRR